MRKMNKAILFLTLIMCSCVGSRRIADPEIHKLAIGEFMEFEKLYYESIDSEKKPATKKVEKLTNYQSEIQSPFKQSSFYVFTYSAYEPPLRAVIVKNDTTEVLNDYFDAERNVLLSSKFIEKINSLIQKETSSFKGDQLEGLLNFMLTVYYGEGKILKLKSWKDIPHNSKNIVSDSLKAIISPFKKEEKQWRYEYMGYVWEQSTSFLYKVDCIFLGEENKIDVNVKNIGAVGVGVISM